VNKHYASASSNRKPEPTASWESLYVGLKQDINIQSVATDFSFETEEVTAF
jgi:DNA mismatch repair protein MutL